MEMSNVLKNINDCYNFNDVSNDQKPKTKRNQRIASTSSAKGKTCAKSSDKLVNKRGQRCDLFRDILSAAVWLNDIRADSRAAIESVIEKLSTHLVSDCNCVNICCTHLLVGNTHFESYLFNQKEFEARIAAEEKKVESKATKEPDEDKEAVINDIPVHKESKLDAAVFPELVNESSVAALLAPLQKALHHWNKALQVGLDMNPISEETIVGFKIYNNLSAVIQIYILYNQLENRLKAAEILHNFCRYYGTKSSEISLTANYYLVKTYIEMGAISKATKWLTRLPSSSSPEQLMPETFGKSLNLLANCELDFLNGRPRRAAKLLKSFLDSEYLQKLTINRYYIKGLSLMIATKFAANDFEYSDCYREFVEPTQMAIAILKRYHSWLSTSKSNSENQMLNSGDLDPLWYKYGVMNFSFDAMQMSAAFYAQIEMPIDTIYYYNAILKLGRRLCATFRIAALLTVGSQLDIICDHKLSAQIKLETALLCLTSNQRSSGSASVFSSSESTMSSSPEQNQETKNRRTDREQSTRYRKLSSDSDLEIIEIIDRDCNHYEYCECNHTKSTNIWDVKKKLRQKRFNVESDSDDSIRDVPHVKSRLSLEKEMKVNDSIDSFILKVQIDFYRLLLDQSHHKETLKQIKDFRQKSVQIIPNILTDKFKNFFQDFNSEEMLDNCSNYNTMQLKVLETMAALEVELQDFEEAIETCRLMKNWVPLTYDQRVIVSNLIYLEAYSSFHLYVAKHSLNVHKFWMEYNLNSINDAMNYPPELYPTTPTRSLSKPFLAPKAPKGKQYSNNEIKDYVNALEKCVYEEAFGKRGGGDPNTTTKIRNTSRSAKSIFDNDSQLRSVSVNESNSSSNDTPISGHPISSGNTVESTVNQRVTRSRANLKTLDQILGSEPTIDSRNKRTIKKSTESNLNIKADDTSGSKSDIDQLDDVFNQLLSISDFEPKEMLNSKSNNSLEFVIGLLNDSFKLMSSHPPSKLYRDIQTLLLKIHSLSEKPNEELIGYYYSETIRSTYRYRYMFINERKKRFNKSSKYDSKPFAFQTKDIQAINSCQKLIASLPTDWRVVQLMTVNHNTKIPDLLICRYQNGKRPVFLKIKTDPEKIIKHFMTHFSEIIEKSNASIVNKDRETFWRLRYSLDEELMYLLRSVEETWFGPFKGILFGQLQSNAYQKLCAHLKTFALLLAEKESVKCLSEPLLELLIESLPAIQFMEYRTAMQIVFKSPSASMITEFFAKYDQMITEIYPVDNRESIFTTYELSPVGLILDKSLESFPFESLPSLNGYNQPIFRIPSLRMLSLMYSTYRRGLIANGVNDSKVYYVVNPADNLAKTEEYFRDTFAAMSQWEGVMGRSPDPQELKRAFDSKEAYIFFGHGAGASYCRTIPEGLDGCNINCASLIIGCSSGKLFSDGKQLESYGTSYRFLLNGCPSYVGVLWDVTDKDIDKFSDQLLSYWFVEWKPEMNDSKKVMANTKAVSKSRTACRLKHLIGAAPVVYGLPLITNRHH